MCCITNYLHVVRKLGEALARFECRECRRASSLFLSRRSSASARSAGDVISTAKMLLVCAAGVTCTTMRLRSADCADCAAPIVRE